MAEGSVAGSRVGRRVVDFSFVTTAVERPILSGRFSAIQRVKCPYLGKILDAAELILHASSGT